MNKSDKDQGARDEARRPEAAREQRGTPETDMQPQDAGTPASGANQGSPAAPVMKQFAKTKVESSGRS